MIDIRRLTLSEYSLLDSFEDAFKPQPDKGISIVAMNNFDVIGRAFILTPAHLEGVLVKPAWRNGTLLQRLVDAAELEARAEGITKLFAYAIDDKKADYLWRLGYEKLPWSVWGKDLA